MNKEAIFSDGTKEYRYPVEPKPYDRVTLRVRIEHGNAAEVYLVLMQVQQIQQDSQNHQNVAEAPQRKLMHLSKASQIFDYYETTIELTDQPLQYCFEIVGQQEYIFYDRYGVTDEIRPQYAFAIYPGFSTPEWSKGAVMYQILVDRFYNGDVTNDVKDYEYYYIKTHSSQVQDWNKVPEDFGVVEFYGGDLEGVRQKLYYLKSLGVEVIYFNPLFVSPSNHKYDIQDYDYIDPHYGRIEEDGGACLSEGDNDNTHATMFQKRVTDKRNLEASNELFIQLVEEAHEKGIRVILDGVFNHCGSFNKWMDRERLYENQEGYEPGAYISKDSPYHKFFQFHEDNMWPYNHTYDGWWGMDTLPKLNYEGSGELQDFILKIAAKWVSPPYNADGWRLDVAADLGHSAEFNHEFWQRFRKVVKEANPEAIVLAEHYGDASAWLSGDQWDTVMNYDAFMEPLSYFLTGMEKHSDAYEPRALGDGMRFESSMRHYMTRFMTPSLQCAMNQLSNHDHSRFLTRTNHMVGRASGLGKEAAGQNVNIAVLKEAAMVQMTWPGAPTLYYGDEAGVCGFTDPDNRRAYPWGSANYPLIDFHRDMIMLHKTSHALRKGSFTFLSCGTNYISYGRFNELEQYVIVVNSSDQELVVDIPVWKAEVPMECQMQQKMLTNERGYSIMPVARNVSGGNLHLSLKAYTGLVLMHEA